MKILIARGISCRLLTVEIILFITFFSGLSHSALVIGYGVVKDENGTEIPYWLCKNSWSENWGENGFFRIIR